MGRARVGMGRVGNKNWSPMSGLKVYIVSV